MTKFTERAGMRGRFSMKVYRRGRLIETFTENNLIVNGARRAMEKLIAGNVEGASITNISFGVSGNVPTPGDEGIADAFTKPVTSVAFLPAAEGGGVEFSWDLLTTEANGKAILEFGLMCADGTLFARRTRATPINKDSDIAIEGQWIINF